jgi:hypothetical protein
MMKNRLAKLEAIVEDLVPREEMEQFVLRLAGIIAENVHDKADRERVLAAVREAAGDDRGAGPGGPSEGA